MKYKVKFGLPDYKYLLRYGEIIKDNEYCNSGGYDRILHVRYMGITYHLHLKNGEVESLVQLDNLPYNEDEEDIQNMKNTSLARLMMLADRDRRDNVNAERVYWLCVREINRRDDNVD